MDNKKKIDFHTDNLAVPEITVDDENDSLDGADSDENNVVYENLAFPEIHIKPAPAAKPEE